MKKARIGFCLFLSKFRLRRFAETVLMRIIPYNYLKHPYPFNNEPPNNNIKVFAGVAWIVLFKQSVFFNNEGNNMNLKTKPQPLTNFSAIATAAPNNLRNNFLSFYTYIYRYHILTLI